MDLALGQVILLLVVSSLVGGASSETLKVSSTGAAARIQGDKLGDYILTNRTQNGRPVYEKTNGVRNNFLYVSSLGVWSVGRTEGATKSGLYNPERPTPSSPPTSGWLYSDLPNGWAEDATLKVEPESASSAGVAAVDQSAAEDESVLGLLLRILAQQRVGAPQAPTLRTPPTTAAPTTAAQTTATPTTAAPTTAAPTTATPTTAAPTTAAPAAPCANRIQVQMGNNLALNQASDIDQAANNFVGYTGVYTLQVGPDVFGNAVYTMGTGANRRTITRVRVLGGEEQWQMTGPAITGRTWATATNPQLINNGEDACPPMSGWSFQIGTNTYSPTPDPQVIVRPFP